MLENIKNAPLITKLLYLLALIVFLIWVIPTMKTYYSNVNKYEQTLQEIKILSNKANLLKKTQIFSIELLKTDTKLLFSKVDLKQIDNKTYELDIQMKEDELNRFHSFIETISLRYYVKIQDNLNFTTEEEKIKVKMILEVL